MTASVYLASASSRRQALLRQIGIDFRVLRVEVDETPMGGEEAKDYVIRMALAKAAAGRDAALPLAPAPVLAADTAVTIDGAILGKPRDRAQALDMMARLSGRSHRVLTGVVLLGNAPASRLSVSQVTFRQVSRAEALRYWRSGEPADKAGGYAIQGLAAAFISRLEGSYTGVMGLPLFETAELLAESGIALNWLSTEHKEATV